MKFTFYVDAATVESLINDNIKSWKDKVEEQAARISKLKNSPIADPFQDQKVAAYEADIHNIGLQVEECLKNLKLLESCTGDVCVEIAE